MIRYKLSKIFTKSIEPIIPWKTFFGDSAKENMELNRNFYRDRMIKNIQMLFDTFENKLKLESENTGTGKAILTVTSLESYKGFDPVKINLSTECSDLLLALGREAVFCLEKDDVQEILYYGNSIHPDNHSQMMGMPEHIADVQKIAYAVQTMTFHALYQEKTRIENLILENGPKPKF